MNARVAYRVTPRVVLGAEALNLLNAKYNDAEYYDAYRLKGQIANPSSADGSYMDHTLHPGEPVEVRASLTLTY